MRQTSFSAFGILKVVRCRKGRGARYYCKGSSRSVPGKQWRARVRCAVCGRRVRLTSIHRVPNHVEPDRLMTRKASA